MRAEEPEDTRTEEEKQAILDQIFAEILADPEVAFRPVPLVYQDFLFQLPMKKLGDYGTDMFDFRRRLAIARAGVEADGGDDDWQAVIGMAESLPEEMQGVFLMLARAARDEEPCPDEALARAYGSHSPSRGRWLLTYMAEQGHIVCDADFRGLRTVVIAASAGARRRTARRARLRSGRRGCRGGLRSRTRARGRSPDALDNPVERGNPRR